MTNQYFLARLAGRDPNIRASDAEREGTADRLRKAHAEGRLDLAEFQERLEHCYQTKTVGELDGLVRDLPREVESNDRRSLGAWRWRLAALAPILIVLFLISAVAGDHEHHGLWLGWLWIPVLFLLWKRLKPSRW